MGIYQNWKDLSISTKLYAVVGTMAILIMVELFTLMFAMDILSGVRAFVGGEGLWSKAQKNAILNIQNYLISRQEKDYQAFLRNMSVPLGDRQARIALMQPVLDTKAVTDGFVKGKNSAEDIPSMIRLMRRFHNVSYLAKAIVVWETADTLADEILNLGIQVQAAVRKTPSQKPILNQDVLLQKISKVNDELTVLEDEFSSTLGAASRWVEHSLLFALMVAVLTVESTGLFFTFRFSRALTQELRDINTVAHKVGAGDFSKVVPISSKDEIGQLAISINTMSASLSEMKVERMHAEEANQIKTLFLANMSHEIRTPLGAMLGFIELLKRRDITKQERKEYLEIISRTGDTVLLIINDILDISKVEAGKIEVHPEIFSLAKMMADLKSLLALRCEEKGIHLQFTAVKEPPEFIITDPSRLRQILVNIIGNAIKFTGRGEVNVSYGISKNKSSMLEFYVKDTGNGIAPENRRRLFKSFSQGDSSIRKSYGGTGLGLALSKNLAQLLGGNVDLENSEVGKGSTFKIGIQIQIPKLSEVPKEVTTKKISSMGVPLKGMKILVVDDAEDNQRLFRIILKKSGAMVELAANGKDGVSQALLGDFDVVLMDMQMPVLDGYAATTNLRAQGYLGPIVAITALTTREDLEKCLKVGCTKVLQKPLKFSNLVTQVAQFKSEKKRVSMA